MKLIQYFLHLNKQKIKLGLHKTQQVHKVKHFDENAAQKVSNFNVLTFFILFLEIKMKQLAMNCSQSNTRRHPNVNMAST